MQHLILIDSTLIVSGLTMLLYKWPHKGIQYTFSQHAAQTKSSYLYYIGFFVVTLPMLLYFFAVWFVPNLALPKMFLLFASIVVIFQIVCTFFPDNGGINTVLHRILTSISAFAMIPLVFMIANGSNVSIAGQIISWLTLCIMFISLFIALANQRGYKWALYLQIAYYGAFLVTIVAATYIG